MAHYETLRHFHMLFASMSILGFVVRFVWMYRDSSLYTKTVVKVFPHIVDTAFLVLGIALIRALSLPLATPWLLTKFALLIAYIVFGTLALKRAPSKRAKLYCFFASIAIFSQILGVAFNHSPWGWLA